MLRSLSLAAVPLFALTFAACATSTDSDELAGEADIEDSLDGKADVNPAGASTYYATKADVRRCAYPMCGGHFLDRLNATQTTCHSGSKAAECYTPELDFSESGLSQAQQDALRGKAASVGEGVHAIVRGRFARKNLTTPQPNLGRFIVTEAWIAQGESASEGVFAKVTLNGVRCITTPCPSIEEKALNSSRKANISAVDFDAGEFTAEAIEGLVEDYTTPGGFIVAGNRYTYKEQGRTGTGRSATQAYRNLANIKSDACVVSGCSGQICADEPMFSTCQFLPEYACYAEATCERQTDGECGWTQTEELTTCIANGGPTQQN